VDAHRRQTLNCHLSQQKLQAHTAYLLNNLVLEQLKYLTIFHKVSKYDNELSKKTIFGDLRSQIWLDFEKLKAFKTIRLDECAL